MSSDQSDKGSSILGSLFARDGIIDHGTYYLRDQPLLLSTLLVTVLVVALGAVASDAARAVAVPIVVLSGLGIGFTFVLLIRERRRGELIGKILEVRGTPAEISPPEGVSNDEGDWVGDAMVSWLSEFCQQAQIVLDVGARRGVLAGDVFLVDSASSGSVEQRSEARDLPDFGSSLRVVEVHEGLSVATVFGYSYRKHLDGLMSKLFAAAADDSETVDTAALSAVLAPIRVGQRAFGLAPGESCPFLQIHDASERTPEKLPDESEADSIIRITRLTDTLRLADEFLGQHGGSRAAPDVLFRKGVTVYELDRPQEAHEVFASFLQRFPFHVSARGAREWIEEIQRELSSGERPPEEDAGEPSGSGEEP
jgi:hypothetical protein